jgi:predicted kinase
VTAAGALLVVLSGLPGVGKTTIARRLSRATGAVHLRIDSIEQILRAAGWDVQGEGYGVAHLVAEDNLRIGRIVVADCVNPWPLTRREWAAVAARTGVPSLDVEIVCPDVAVHRQRVESRVADIDGHALPGWTDVLQRDYQPWTTDRLVVDTAALDVGEAVRLIESAMAAAS